MVEAWTELVKTKEGYRKLLDQVMANLPQTLGKIGDRVLVVNPIIVHETKRTIITNFTHIADTLNREPSHLARFILKESGKAGTLEGERLLIQGKITNEELRRFLELYVKEFVKCPVCGGLDTKIIAEKRFRFILCEICGAKSSVRKI
ncbi:MAG: translation initiation factor IF-2 subunit beta [Aigarchaeota archaeon]|nr:translation initiation factor IF-2 subunit beta [Aigarchaeota archaeon]MCX8193457.1 translation initiation factor IF-2 subunit beta [Nitrososphaeria archaeon]MDW7985811.1 translation initiation factor IF-2 subunit beta [Nitrososphaerota archaeon]